MRKVSSLNRQYTYLIDSILTIGKLRQPSPGGGAPENSVRAASASVATANLDAAHQYPAADCDRLADHHGAPGSGAAGANDAGGAYHRIGVFRFEGHRCGESHDGGGDQQK